MNLWHDVPRGEKAPDEINVIIEIPRNSANKYEIDKDTGLIKLDRANYSSAPYPFDYGFIPQTLWDDGDAFDVIVMTTYPLEVGILVEVRPVALMKMEDEGESDWKIVAVPVEDKRWEDVQDLADVNNHHLKEYAHFLETYKELENDEKDLVTIHGTEDKEAAKEAINRSINLYQEKY